MGAFDGVSSLGVLDRTSIRLVLGRVCFATASCLHTDLLQYEASQNYNSVVMTHGVDTNVAQHAANSRFFVVNACRQNFS